MAAKKTSKKTASKIASAPAPKTSSAKKTNAQIAAEVILKRQKIKPIGFGSDTYDAVSSGSTLVDDLIGGTLAPNGKPVCPGFPRRRISEVYGPEASGKTTLALHALAEVRKAGGTAFFLDFEHAIHHGYAKKLGVVFDQKHLMLYQPDYMEQGFEQIQAAILGGVDLIVVDSVAAMVPKSELLKGVQDAATIGAQARLLSQNLPKMTAWLNNEHAKKQNPLGTAIIFINQERSTVNTGGGRGASSSSSGGKALKYYTSLRLQTTRIRSETIKRKDKYTGKERSFPYGNHTQVKVVKSRMDAKQGHTTDIFIRYGYGIDEYYSIIEAGVTNRIIRKKTGGWHIYRNDQFQGREKFRLYLKENPKVFEALRQEVLRIVQAPIEEMIPDDNELDDTDSLMVEMDKDDDSDTYDAPEEVELSEDDFPSDATDDSPDDDDEGSDDEGDSSEP